jgi:ABC-2 type transport system ATP-binding protein
MHEPDVLFLDEPTNNLDPQSRRFLWERIGQLRERGVTIVLTTHDMEEADRLCDRIAIMDRGRVLALDTPDGLRRLIPGGTMLEMRVRTSDGATRADELESTLGHVPDVTRVERPAPPVPPVPPGPPGHGEALDYRLYASEESGAMLAGAVHAVTEARAELEGPRLARPSLEDVFIHLTGSNLRS